MAFQNVYVAATSQHVGKTTTTLGLVSTMMKRGHKVGYCKPVGQKFLDVQNLRVDKDTLLFADLIHFDLQPKLHSPVILGPGATTAFLDHPEQYPARENILKAARELNENNEMLIFEGTGHPGVGSVAELSNARVAKMLNAGVIMVVEGGIGSTIDKLNMCLALFREENVPILGIIVNKVLPEKMAKVRKYVNKWLVAHDLELLGVVPYDKSLAYPVIKTIADSINGMVTHNSDRIYNKVEDILAGSLIDLKELKSFKDLLLVASVRSLDEAIKKISSISDMIAEGETPLSGIVATGQGTPGPGCLEYIDKYKIPMIRTNLDTYGSVIKISRIEVKINRNTPWKINRAIELVEQNVRIDRILEQITVKETKEV